MRIPSRETRVYVLSQRCEVEDVLAIVHLPHFERNPARGDLLLP